MLIQKMVKSKSEDSLNFETNNNSSSSVPLAPTMSNSSSATRVSAAPTNAVGEEADENSEVNIESGSASESASLKSTTSSLDNPSTNTNTSTGVFATQQPISMSTLKIIDPYSSSSAINSNNTYEFNEAQELFRSQINSALRKLFSFLDIDYESSMNHR